MNLSDEDIAESKAVNEIVEKLNDLEEERFEVDDHGNHLVEPSVWIEIENEARADEGEDPLTEQEEQEIYDNFDRAQARFWEIHCEKKRLLNEYFLLKGSYPDVWESFGKERYTESAECRSGYFIKKTVDDYFAWSNFGREDTEDVFIRFDDDEEGKIRAEIEFDDDRRNSLWGKAYRAELYKWEDFHPVLLDTIKY